MEARTARGRGLAWRRGDFRLRQNGKITGIHFDGGYAETRVAPAEAVAAMPDDLPAAEAAPLLCAGITVFNALRNAGMRSRELVAVQEKAFPEANSTPPSIDMKYFVI